MSLSLWQTCPERYRQCERCGACCECDGKGSVVGPDYYLIGGRLGRRSVQGRLWLNHHAPPSARHPEQWERLQPAG